MLSSADIREAREAQLDPNVGVKLLPAAEVERQWVALEPCFVSAAGATYGRYTPEDLRELVRRDLLDCFAVVDWSAPELLAVLLLQRFETPQAVVGEIAFCGALGEATPMPPGGWVRAFNQIKEYCGAAGCTQIQLCGRPGWGRVLGLEPNGANFVVALRPRNHLREVLNNG